jgi:hypothetical protein
LSAVLSTKPGMWENLSNYCKVDPIILYFVALTFFLKLLISKGNFHLLVSFIKSSKLARVGEWEYFLFSKDLYATWSLDSVIFCRSPCCYGNRIFQQNQILAALLNSAAKILDLDLNDVF